MKTKAGLIGKVTAWAMQVGETLGIAALTERASMHHNITLKTADGNTIATADGHILNARMT